MLHKISLNSWYVFLCSDISKGTFTQSKSRNESKNCLSCLSFTLCYRPQRSCGQGNIFAPVCHSVHSGGLCLGACWDTTPPPPEQTHTPWSRHPPDTPRDQTPSEQTPPRSRHPLPEADTPPKEADSGIRSMNSRYASYWNTFLFPLLFGLKRPLTEKSEQTLPVYTRYSNVLTDLLSISYALLTINFTLSVWP